MGLFGGILKVVGKVAKAGLSVATRGVSDKVLAVLKSKGAAKQVAASPDLTAQQMALVEKLKPLSPKTKNTEQVLRDVSQRVLYGGGGGGSSTRKRMPKGYRKPKRSYEDLADERERRNAGGFVNSLEELDARNAQLARKRAKKVKVKVKRVSTGRKAPSGGLDLKKISSMWAAAGKPGTWIGFIKANSHVRKA